MEAYPFTVTTSQPMPMDISASFLYYESVTDGRDNPRIRIQAKHLDQVLRPGQGIKLPANIGKFIIKNEDAVATIKGVILWSGEGREVFSNRILGDVSVIDGARSVSIADKAFSGTYYQSAGVATYAAIQLWNPSNSGKRLVVWDYWTWTDSGGGYAQSVGRYLTQLASNSGVLVSHGFRASANASSVAQLRNEALAALPSAADFKKISNVTEIAYTEQLHALKHPVIVYPGVGLTWIQDGVNKPISVRVSFNEEDDS